MEQEHIHQWVAVEFSMIIPVAESVATNRMGQFKRDYPGSMKATKLLCPSCGQVFHVR